MQNQIDLKTQQQLLKTKIPQKRTFNQRKKIDQDLDSGDEGKQAPDSDYDSEIEIEPNTAQRLNDGEGGADISHVELNTSIQNAMEASKNLPIAKHKQTIVTKLENNKVIIISGDTGCGKTTQVPKYILENAMHRKQEVKIICTQPRRLAAVNIAKRVAQELGQKVGHTIGYQVGMQRKTTPGVTKVVFMTTGIFLMRLVNNPQSLKHYTHLIMDEVHERDLDIDFSLVVVKHLLSRSDSDDELKFKLILMSATFNTSLFANYFAKASVQNIEKVNAYEGAQEAYEREEILRKEREAKEWGDGAKGGWDTLPSTTIDDDDEWVETKPSNQMEMPVKQQVDPADIIEINARCFEVKEMYLDELVKNLTQEKRLELTSQDKELLAEGTQPFGVVKPQIRESPMRVACMVVCDVIERLNAFSETEKQSVLIFLPGLAEIMQFIDYMYEFYDRQWIKQTFELIPLHSSLNEDEQDRAFRPLQKLEGKRKVIVATNIAESSITIPDVKYVIDFMLTKELHYDPASKSESLQLVWSSKASAKQRAGRAGRVSDGFVFRMVTKNFYTHSLPEFPMPEMQRCPLEKLILQIKLWNKYEPEEILGRAIQPPELRDIFNAIKNLQQTGALTIPPPILKEDGSLARNDTHKPRITALGKIFVNLPVDLKITRLFLFGMSLKCMSQAIQIGCLHAQTRSIFKRNASVDPVNLSKLQCMYDEKRDSDSIMLLRVYQEWVHKFHPYLKHKKSDEDEAQEKRPDQRRHQNESRIYIKRPMQAERKWCGDHNLDFNVLRDVTQLVEEVRNRFIRINISPQCLNSKVSLRDDNPDGELILKICIGGAFYNKYVKAAYKNADQLSRSISNPRFNPDEASRTLVLNKVNEHITALHLKQFFEAKFKVGVEKIQLNQDKPMIVFKQEILDKGFLKSCFRMGLRNRMSRYKKLQEDEYAQSQQFRSTIMSDTRQKAKNVHLSYDEAREMLESEEIRRPHYLYELRYETINKESFVDFDLDSINNFTMENDMAKIEHITYACQEFYDKGGRFLCRNSTKLPDVPMVDVLFCLVFAPLVQVMSDDTKTYFNRLICDGGEMILPLSHVLTHQDLEIAQKVRTLLNETLCDADKQKQAHMAQVDFWMKKLLSFRRLQKDVYIKLELLRDEDESVDRKRFLQQLKEKEAQEENFFFEDADDGDGAKGFEDVNMDEQGDILTDRQNRYEADCERGYFLQPIYVQRISKKIYFYDEKVGDMQAEFRERISRKRDLIDKIRRKCKEFQLKDTMIICERCKQDLAPLKTVDFQSEELHFSKCVFGSFKPVDLIDAMTDRYEEDREFIELYNGLHQEEVERDKLQGKKESTFQFCSCNNGHIVGIIKDQKYYLTDISPVMMMFPLGVYESWDSRYWGQGYKAAFNYEKQLNFQKSERQRSNNRKNQKVDSKSAVVCEICQTTLATPEDFIVHCKFDPDHKALEQKFTDETFDFLFTNSANAPVAKPE